VKAFAPYFADTLQKSMGLYASEDGFRNSGLFLHYLDKVFKLNPKPITEDQTTEARLTQVADTVEYDAKLENEPMARTYLGAYHNLFLSYKNTRQQMNSSYLGFLRANPAEQVWNAFNKTVAGKSLPQIPNVNRFIDSFQDVAKNTQLEGLADLYARVVQKVGSRKIDQYESINKKFANVSKNIGSTSAVSLFDNIVENFYSGKKTNFQKEEDFFASLEQVFHTELNDDEIGIFNQVITDIAKLDTESVFADERLTNMMRDFFENEYHESDYALINKFLKPIAESSTSTTEYLNRLGQALMAVLYLGINNASDDQVAYIGELLEGFGLAENLDSSLEFFETYAKTPYVKSILELDEKFPEVKKSPKAAITIIQTAIPGIKQATVEKSTELFEALTSHMNAEEQSKEILDILAAVSNVAPKALDMFLGKTFAKKVFGPIKAFTDEYVADITEVLSGYGALANLNLKPVELAEQVDQHFDYKRIRESGLALRLEGILASNPTEVNVNPEYFQWRLDRLDSIEAKTKFLDDLEEVLEKNPHLYFPNELQVELARKKFNDYFKDRDWNLDFNLGRTEFYSENIFGTLIETNVPGFMLLNFEDALDKKVYQEPYQACEAIANMTALNSLASESRGADLQKYTEVFYVGHHPFRPGTQEAMKAFNQSIQVLRNNIERGRSSVQDAYSFRKVCDDAKVQYTDFVNKFLDVPVEPLPSKKGWKDNTFPGNGYIFGNFKLTENIKNFVSIATWHLPPDIDRLELEHHEKVELGKKRSRTLLSSLENSKIYRLRGATVIKPNAQDRKFHLLSAAGKPESFSYIFFNEHHANPTNSTGFLVPTRILDGLKTAEDFARVIAPEKLLYNDEVLNLGSAVSIYGSGLSAARKRGSDPYHKHETDPYFYRDIGNRPHYSSEISGWQGAWNTNLDAKTAPHRQDQKDVADISFKFNTMIKQLDHLEALHIMGYDNFDNPDSVVDAEPTEFDENSIPGNLGYAFKMFDAWSQDLDSKPAKDKGHEAVLVDLGVNAKASAATDWRFKLDPVSGKFYDRTEPDKEPQILDIKGNKETIEVRILKHLFEGQQKGVYRTLRFVPRNITD
jgi:hypothetical protein